MSSLFDYRDDRSEPLLVRLDTLLETHGIEPTHVLGDADSPMVVTIGAGRYVSSKDLARYLHWRAEIALMQRMGKSAPPKPRRDYADELVDTYRLGVEDEVKSALAEADQHAPEAA
jgi:hypothetical protein